MKVNQTTRSRLAQYRRLKAAGWTTKPGPRPSRWARLHWFKLTKNLTLFLWEVTDDPR